MHEQNVDITSAGCSLSLDHAALFLQSSALVGVCRKRVGNVLRASHAVFHLVFFQLRTCRMSISTECHCWRRLILEIGKLKVDIRGADICSSVDRTLS